MRACHLSLHVPFARATSTSRHTQLHHSRVENNQRRFDCFSPRGRSTRVSDRLGSLSPPSSPVPAPWESRVSSVPFQSNNTDYESPFAIRVRLLIAIANAIAIAIAIVANVLARTRFVLLFRRFDATVLPPTRNSRASFDPRVKQDWSNVTFLNFVKICEESIITD